MLERINVDALTETFEVDLQQTFGWEYKSPNMRENFLTSRQNNLCPGRCRLVTHMCRLLGFQRESLKENTHLRSYYSVLLPGFPCRAALFHKRQ